MNYNHKEEQKQKAEFHAFAKAWGYDSDEYSPYPGDTTCSLRAESGNLSLLLKFFIEDTNECGDTENPYIGIVTCTLSPEEFKITGEDSIEIEAYGETLDEVLQKLQGYYAEFVKAKSKNWRKFKKYIKRGDFGDDEELF